MATAGDDDGTAIKSEMSMDKQTLLAVLQFLKKNNLKDTEGLLRKEANLTDEDVKLENNSGNVQSDVTQVLAAYRSEGDPSWYEEEYSSLKQFIENSLDVHKCEMSCILYPIFVHMYLELVYNNHEEQAKAFFERFSGDQEEYYEEDLRQLITVTKSEHMRGNQLLENFKGSEFTIRMSRDSYTHLKRHLAEKKHSLLLNIIQEHLFVDVFDGAPRNKQQIDSTAGAMLGNAKRDANKVKVLYGLLKEPDINVPLDDDDDADITGTTEDGRQPKKKKPKRDPSLMKKSKTDPNAPLANRIPLPELRDSDKLEKARAYREASKRVTLGPDNLPSICFFTFMNAFQGVTSVQVCDDSSLLAAGFSDSLVRVWSLTSNKLRSIKSPDELNIIDKEADDVLERIMDDRTAADSKVLLGHTGPVYATSFSHDRNHLITSSEDGTVRLWSLQTWTNLVCYKGHLYPVWDAKFGPYGHYFVSASHDRTARLWTTDHYQPIRIFAGHLADVDCVEFHPNSNYIATGSTDRTVRLWDIQNGNCVRVMTGHKGPVHSLTFSPDGKYLTSAGIDKLILVWDVSSGELVAQLRGHTDTVYTMAYSREASLLASGGLDNTVRLWDMGRIAAEQDSESGVIPNVNDARSYQVATYPTKSSPVLGIHFTRRNLLYACGPYTHT